MTLLGYIRVSTDEQGQSGLGLAAQRAALESEAARRGGILEAVYEDVASGGKANRPGWKAARDHAARTHGTILVAKLDRLTRGGVGAALAVLDEAKAGGYHVACMDAPVDMGSDMGELVYVILAWAAGFERKRGSERTRAAWAVRKALDPHAGEQPHRRCGTDAIERMVALKQSGQGLERIAATLQDEGYATAQGGRWHASTVRYLLNKHARS